MARAQHNAATDRFFVQPTAPEGGMLSRPVSRRNFEVQAFTGRPVSTVPDGQWNRGQFYRTNTPALHMPRNMTMYDPTDPRTWPWRAS